MKRFFAVTLLTIAVCFVFSSCNRVIENSNFDTNGAIIVKGEKVVPEYVMKINDDKISLAEYRYYYLNQKNELDGGNDKVWTEYPDYVEDLKEYVENILVEVYSIRALAQEKGVEPDFELVAEEIKTYKEGMSEKEYKKGLESYYLTDELYEYILQGYQLYDALFDYYFGENGTKVMTEAELAEYVDENYIHAKHILIYPNTTMTDEEYAQLLSTVESKAMSGEDFDQLIDEYSDDDAMPDYGYYFTAKEMPEEIVSACELLDEGEVSGLVKSSHGYHIIKKLPTDTNDIPELKNVVYNEIFTRLVDDKIASAEIEYAPEYEYVTPTTVK